MVITSNTTFLLHADHPKVFISYTSRSSPGDNSPNALAKARYLHIYPAKGRKLQPLDG